MRAMANFGNNPRTIEIYIPKRNGIKEIKVIWPSGTSRITLRYSIK